MRFNTKILLAVGYWLFFNGYVKSQINLVPNPSFEDTISCSNNSFTLPAKFAASGWWKINTPDYYNQIYSNMCSWGGGVPYNIFGFQYPHSGKSYAGMITFVKDTAGKNYREWIQTKLNDSLKAGKKYCASFYFNKASSSFYSTDKLGAYISVNGINLLTDSFIQYNSQLYTPNTIYLNDTMNWTLYKSIYTATGSEQYIALGNFFNDSNTDTLANPSLIYTEGYYFIDDVSLIPIDLTPYAGHDTTITQGDSAYIGRASEVGLDDDCVWYKLGSSTAIDTVAGMWIKPTTTTSYVVEQNICGAVTHDTVVVTVNPNGVKEYANNEYIIIYPNPASNTISLTIAGVTDYQNSFIEIQNIVGQTVKKLSFTKNIDVSDISQGCYFIQIILPDKETFQTKFIKE